MKKQHNRENGFDFFFFFLSFVLIVFGRSLAHFQFRNRKCQFIERRTCAGAAVTVVFYCYSCSCCCCCCFFVIFFWVSYKIWQHILSIRNRLGTNFMHQIDIIRVKSFIVIHNILLDLGFIYYYQVYISSNLISKILLVASVTMEQFEC